MGRPNFKKVDISRAILATEAAGLAVGQVILSLEGELRLVIDRDGVTPPPAANSFDGEFGAC